jgi:hypothetical protein
MMAGVRQKSENTQIHRRMNTVMPREKIKFALRISPEVQQLVKDMCPRDNCQSQNEFIEKAIRFYAGHISAKDTAELLPQFFVSALRGAIQDTENRICRLLFKQAGQIFRQELTELYQEQTIRRDELTRKSGEVMRQMIQQMQTGELRSERMEQLMEQLAQRLQSVKGKNSTNT